MPGAFRKIAVVGRHEDPRVADAMSGLVEFLLDNDIEVLAAPDIVPAANLRRLPEDELADEADLIIAVGGDGTMLYAARLASEKDVPLVGVNRGRLGFLADVTPDEMLDSVMHVLNGDYTRDSRLQLEAVLERPGGETTTAIALNDVVLQRRETGRMVDFETCVNEVYVNTHAGDGLIVATPTGSTAYALSCGGPILQPQLDAVVIVPVCPHTLTDRPIVVPASQPIGVRLLERDETKAEITVDGVSIGDIRPDDRLTIRAASNRTTLLHPPGYDYYGILRSKLFWGRDSRVRHQES